MPLTLGRFARFLVGAHVEADDRGAGGFRERHVGFGDAADAGMDDARADLVGAELFQRADDRFERALHVGLDDQREVLAARRLELRHHLLERAAHAGRMRRALLALLADAVVGEFARAGFALDHGETVAGLRRAGKAQHFDRNRRAGLLHRVAGVVDQRADAAPFGAGDDDVADTQRAALHQHGRDRAAAAVELGFDHGAFGGAVRIGLEVEDFGLQPDHFEQLVEVGLLGRRDFDVDHVAAHRLRPAPRAAAVRCARASAWRPACRSC